MENQSPMTANTADTVFVAPPVNICETNDAILVEAEMPGVDKNGLEVSIDGDELVIHGKRDIKPESGEPVWREIPLHHYRRVFSLGDHINRASIHASFENGILTLKLGKAEDVKPRKIEVNYN
ncbi:MAG: Hsp20/alpha crystallin family protein [Verrucomicrobiae bacterium]|nr:Hsp20/alpha crystallin family protein [Verrucomicrobiae bacterium]